jgi:hypothetical protein
MCACNAECGISGIIPKARLFRAAIPARPDSPKFTKTCINAEPKALGIIRLSPSGGPFPLFEETGDGISE